MLTVPNQDFVTTTTQNMEIDQDSSEHNNFCIICQDGSNRPNLLICCNDYPQITCVNCLDIPRLFQCTVQAENIIFRCLMCHIGWQRDDENQEPYFMTLVVHGFYKSRLSSSMVLFLHLNMVDDDTTGGPFKLAYQFIQLGDLFTGYVNGKYISAAIDEFLMIILKL
ncbi:uncharacterized protein F5891DRAFT_976562 [Suillus fuscotomentosus]|uniref:Uncharacterized protein n=1 Tax=Suillus fuscotomentosus TaxID=1912939 RepID=A0AAD4EF54_9AGAM|nr:uncharacterized protein F5891DRAFT_976562 [Suillus fuscotomentosus]KAG1904985.1 hypothetical protein F5891DRAFT_976562 [Suillus fuscotomentosus]